MRYIYIRKKKKKKGLPDQFLERDKDVIKKIIKTKKKDVIKKLETEKYIRYY